MGGWSVHRLYFHWFFFHTVFHFSVGSLANNAVLPKLLHHESSPWSSASIMWNWLEPALSYTKQRHWSHSSEATPASTATPSPTKAFPNKTNTLSYTVKWERYLPLETEQQAKEVLWRSFWPIILKGEIGICLLLWRSPAHGTPDCCALLFISLLVIFPVAVCLSPL